MENKELTFKMEKTAHYLVGGLSIKETADLVGVTTMTVYRYLKIPAVQALIRELRRISIEHSIGRLQRMNDAAIECLERNLTCGNHPSEVRAAVAILTKNHEFQDFYDYDTRLKNIEARFDEKI